jgi:hypothetical protein
MESKQELDRPADPKIEYDYVQCTKKNFFRDEMNQGRHPNKPNNVGVNKI